MTEVPQLHALLIGLPKTGKTTFLAGLWHIVQDNSTESLLELSGLEGDRTYLNRIHKSWLSCSEIGRTNLNDMQTVKLSLNDKNGRHIQVIIPDHFGEVFQLQLSERRWSPEYEAMAQSADGILLFVHPGKLNLGPRLDIANILAITIKEANDTSSAEGNNDDKPKPWTYDDMPTQVGYVELLQFLLERRGSDKGLNTVVIISAWDLIPQGNPDEVLRTYLPLLHQFLESNNDIINYSVVGVSAQGGDLKRDHTKLVETMSASDRIQVEGLNCPPHDITAPISWLLDQQG